MGASRRDRANHRSESSCSLETLEPRRYFAIFDTGGNPISEGAVIRDLTAVGSQLFFSAGRSIMKFDPARGTSAVVKTFWGVGEQAYKNGNTGFRSKTAPAELTAVNSTLFFTVDDGVHGWELWKSDGTDAGTVLVKDIIPRGASSSPNDLIAFNGKLFFTARTREAGEELWISDGTAAGTRQVIDLAPGASASFPSKKTIAHGKLYFINADRALYRTDGAAAGTGKVLDIPDSPFEFIPAGDNLYVLDNPNIATTTSGGGGRLRRVGPDGAISTVFNRADNNYLGDGQPHGIAFAKRLYFTSPDPTYGVELFSSTGTVGGTKLVRDLDPGPSSAGVQQFFATNSALYFSTQYGSQHTLWKSDGTAEGTVAVGGWQFGDNAQPRSFAAVGERVYYSTYEGIFTIDGTTPRLVAASSEFYESGTLAFGDSLYFIGGGLTLFSGDGTLSQLKPDGTLIEHSVTRPDSAIVAPPLAAAGQKTYLFTVTFTSRMGLNLFGLLGAVSRYGALDEKPLFHVTGPGGFERDATFIADDRIAEGIEGRGGAIRTVTYAVRAPGGTWDAADSGTYTISLAGDVEDLPYNFAEHRVLGTFRVSAAQGATGSVTGTVFEDFDHDGTRDVQEQRGAGGRFNVFLDTTPNSRRDPGEPIVSTDERGRFTFSNLAPGDYRVRLDNAKTRAETTGVKVVTVRGGTTELADLGVTDSATLTGVVFDDANANGVRDAGETPLSRVVVWDDLNNDGIADSFEPATRTTADGAYSLTVPTGRSRLRAILPGGYRFSVAPADALDLGAASVTAINLPLTARASITGAVFHDADADGIRSDSETGLFRAQVYLDTNDNGQLDAGEPSVRSRSDGRYRIDNIPPGRYRVRVNPLDASHVITAGAGYIVRLAGGATVKRSFGQVQAALFTGHVFDDRNLSYHFDSASDPGLANRIVFVDLNGSGVLDEGEPSDTTDSSGAYSIATLPGTRHIVLQAADGWRMARGRASVTRESATAQNVVTDFANTNKALLTGVAFIDQDGDHLFTPDGWDYFRSDGGAYLDLNNDRTFDAGEPFAASAYPTGYLLVVDPGTYHVRYAPGELDTLVNNDGYTITLAAAEVRAGLNFELV